MTIDFDVIRFHSICAIIFRFCLSFEPVSSQRKKIVINICGDYCGMVAAVVVIGVVILVIAPTVAMTTKMMTTIRVIKDETKVVNPKETAIFHTKINMTAMIKER